MTKDYVVATIRPWNLAAFARHAPTLPGRWHLVHAPEELEGLLAGGLRPRYVFFPHWSWKVSERIFQTYECVGFHMTDLPYGRGGSPLQNLIVRGCGTTRLTALRIEAGLDAGPIYAQCDLSLAGRAQEIYERAAERVYELIGLIVHAEPQARPQKGEVVVFTRRTPEEGRLPEADDLRALYDHIRMLDAEGYPHAFLDHGPWRIEFVEAEVGGDALHARVSITRRTQG